MKYLTVKWRLGSNWNFSSYNAFIIYMYARDVSCATVFPSFFGIILSMKDLQVQRQQIDLMSI